MSNRQLYRYRITGIDRLDEKMFGVHLEVAPNGVYGIKHLPGSTAGISSRWSPAVRSAPHRGWPT